MTEEISAATAARGTREAVEVRAVLSRGLLTLLVLPAVQSRTFRRFFDQHFVLFRTLNEKENHNDAAPRSRKLRRRGLEGGRALQDKARRTDSLFCRARPACY